MEALHQLTQNIPVTLPAFFDSSFQFVNLRCPETANFRFNPADIRLG